MADRVKGLFGKVLEWWNKFTSKQKTILVSATAGIIVTIVIIAAVLTRPQYVLLANCESTKEAAQITELLDANGLTYEVSNDALRISILKDQQSKAEMLLGANDIQAAGYSIDNVVEGSFTSTEADKQKKYQLYLESKLGMNLERLTAVKTATVDLSLPDNDGTLISSDEEAFATVYLELDGEFTSENAAYVARAVATGIGNTTTNNIVVLDTDGNMLFSGDDNYTMAGVANSQLNIKTQAETMVKNEVKRVLLGTKEFDNVEVASNLSLDFSTTDSTEHTYSAPDGQTQGLLSREDIFNSESTNSNGGVPGTDSNNDGTTYTLQDNAESSSTQSEESREYLPNETIISKTIPAGLIKYDESSLAVTAVDYNIVKEEEARDQGLLDGITWSEYKLNNQGKTKIEVDPDLYNVVANATGIDADRITIVAYRENVFFDREGFAVSATDAVQIALVVVILALLAFVVLRSMRGEKEEAPEEELSVETLLQSTPEENLEDIGVEAQSETRKLIDKFVDENPEAAASLLRNWLNEDWG